MNELGLGVGECPDRLQFSFSRQQLEMHSGPVGINGAAGGCVKLRVRLSTPSATVGAGVTVASDRIPLIGSHL